MSKPTPLPPIVYGPGLLGAKPNPPRKKMDLMATFAPNFAPVCTLQVRIRGAEKEIQKLQCLITHWRLAELRLGRYNASVSR